jgi:hypothetical protein
MYEAYASWCYFFRITWYVLHVREYMKTFHILDFFSYDPNRWMEISGLVDNNFCL